MLAVAYVPHATHTTDDAAIQRLRRGYVTLRARRPSIETRFLATLSDFNAESELARWAEMTGERLDVMNFSDSFNGSVLRSILLDHFRDWRDEVELADSDGIWDDIRERLCTDCDESDGCSENCQRAYQMYDDLARDRSDLHLEYLAQFFPKYSQRRDNLDEQIMRRPLFGLGHSGKYRLETIGYIARKICTGCSSGCQECARDRGPTDSRWLYTRWPELLKRYAPRGRRIEATIIDDNVNMWATTGANIGTMRNITYQYVPDPETITATEVAARQQEQMRMEQQRAREEFIARMRWMENVTPIPPLGGPANGNA
ncbi:MAG: hypothetical protein MUC88_20755 [Planctomycetes bacterium]|nr:hypothetical protein [Planctomycetota bacterium]